MYGAGAVRRSLLLLAVLGLLAVPPGAAAQDQGDFPVVVFEGRGLGHGAGMPLDGANALARSEDATADDLHDRFYPGAGRGSGEGLVRLLLAAREDVSAGVEVLLPDGGTVRDGRATPVAPSFPIRVRAGGRVRLTFEGGRYRAEVLDERSVSGTVEITPSDDGTTSTAPGGPAPALAASERSVWIAPRAGGALLVDGEEPAFHGMAEVVVEAERLHLVGELDVEEYLAGLDLAMPDGTPLEPAALEAAVIAARSYALRAAGAVPRVGRFHLYADERSFPYAGPDEAPGAVARAVGATKGRTLTQAGDPIAALVSVSAGGVTAAPAELFGREAPAVPYLTSEEYPGGEDFGWRVDMDLREVARRLGYTGDADGVAVASTGPSGRPTALRVTGTAGVLEVETPDFHAALRLPSSRFEVRLESRAEPVPARADSPAFQELPGVPLDGDDDAALEALAQDGDGDEDGRGSSRLPLIMVAGAGLSLLVAFAVLMLADIQRRVRMARERRAARRRHPARTPPPP